MRRAGAHPIARRRPPPARGAGRSGYCHKCIFMYMNTYYSRRAGVYSSRAGTCDWQPKPRTAVAEAARAWRPKPPQLDALRVSRVLGVLLHCLICCLDRPANHVSVLLGIRETSCSQARKCSCITISAPSRVLISAFSAFLASLYSLEISS